MYDENPGSMGSTIFGGDDCRMVVIWRAASFAVCVFLVVPAGDGVLSFLVPWAVHDSYLSGQPDGL